MYVLEMAVNPRMRVEWGAYFVYNMEGITILIFIVATLSTAEGELQLRAWEAQ